VATPGPSRQRNVGLLLAATWAHADGREASSTPNTTGENMRTNFVFMMVVSKLLKSARELRQELGDPHGLAGQE